LTKLKFKNKLYLAIKENWRKNNGKI